MTLNEARRMPLSCVGDHAVVLHFIKGYLGPSVGKHKGPVVELREKLKEHFGEDAEFFNDGKLLIIALPRERVRIEVAF